MKYTECVNQYSAWKLSTKGTSVVTSKELGKIREAYKQGIFDGENVPTSAKRVVRESAKAAPRRLTEAGKQEYASRLAKYREWKKAEKGTMGVTLREKEFLMNTLDTPLNEECNGAECDDKEKQNGAGNVPAGDKVAEAIAAKKAAYREWKKANKGVSFITLKESAAIEASVKKHMKENTVLTPDETRQKIREAHKAIFNAKKCLREGDMVGAADQTQLAGDATNAVDAATAGAAAGAVPQNIVDAVTNLKSTVDDLATQCGIQSPVDTGADAGAGVPPVTGAPADPNAAPAPAPAMTESQKVDLNAVRERLNKRAATLASMKENSAQDVAKNMMAGIHGANPNFQTSIAPESRTVAKGNDESQLPMPSTSELVNGSKTAGKTWPTEKITMKESMAEQMVTNHLKEAQETMDFKAILASGILG